jgi:hypothetical protein
MYGLSALPEASRARSAWMPVRLRGSSSSFPRTYEYIMWSGFVQHGRLAFPPPLGCGMVGGVSFFREKICRDPHFLFQGADTIVARALRYARFQAAALENMARQRWRQPLSRRNCGRWSDRLGLRWRRSRCELAMIGQKAVARSAPPRAPMRHGWGAIQSPWNFRHPA